MVRSVRTGVLCHARRGAHAHWARAWAIYSAMQLSIAIAALAMIATMSATAQPGQKPMTPTAPGTSGDPAWQGIVRLSDGRVFVTDGGLAIEAALAKPAKLPDRELAAKILG